MKKTLVSGRELPHRVRNDLRFRQIIVSEKQQVADVFWRITFKCPDLAGFSSPGTDDHIKLFFPEQPLTESPQMTDQGINWPNNQRPAARDYTPLTFNGVDSLVVDFFRHQEGIASQWAEDAQVGDSLLTAGPKASLLVPSNYQHLVAVLDETGLPALKRRLAVSEAEKHTVIAYAAAGVVKTYLQEHLASIDLYCLEAEKMDADGLNAAIKILETVSFQPDDYFIWLTGEGKAVKQLSDYFTGQRQCHPELVRAVAYWHQKTGND